MPIDEIRTRNISRFLLPFYIENNKKGATILNIGSFTRFDISPRYLVKSVKEMFGSEENAVCKCLYLNDSARADFNLPPRYTRVSMVSTMRGCSGKYEFILAAERLYLFSTGIGFLETEIQYVHDNLDEIADISFCLSNIFTNEHDSEGKYNNLTFSYADQDDEKTFSLKNALIGILCGSTDKNRVTLFPTNDRKRLIGYHVLFAESNENIDKHLYALSGMLNSNAYYDQESANNTVGSSVSKQKWSISPSGCASIAVVNSGNVEFMTKAFKKNALSDYYDIFLLTIHEREVLLQYNYQAVQNRNNNKALIKMKNKLIQLEVLYTYNTISTEAAYQRFYSSICEELNISSLEEDIRNVVENVESHVNDRKDRKVNTLLTAISVLAIFSVLTDGISFADRIQSGDPFGAMQWGVISVVAIIIIVAIYVLKKK